MDHLVAIAVELEGGARRFYMTWGRIQHAVDPEPLEQLVLRYCMRNDLGGNPLKARMCQTLQEASHAPFFYEALFSFSQTHIPFGDHYKAWRSELNERMQRGEELYYLGNPDRFAHGEPMISGSALPREKQEVSCPTYPQVDVTAMQSAETDWVTVIESHIDNMTGELLGGFMERLFSVGALDVSYTPIQMKKNRPATLLTVLCLPEIGEQLASLVLQETTTLGVRMQQVRRLKAQRYQETIATSLGPILVKVKRLGSRIISVAPEYEECQRIASEHDVPLIDVYEIARAAIQSTIVSNPSAQNL
jgi:Nickel insertion protein